MRILPAVLACIALAAPARDDGPLATAVIENHVVYTVEKGDTLSSLASRFGVDTRTIARQNQRTTAQPLKVGTTLQIDASHIVPAEASLELPILINIPQKHLFLTTATRTDAFPIAVGRPTWRTPTGNFTIVLKEEHPTWDVPPSIQEEMRRTGKPVLKRVPPSSANPLGDYWLGLSLPNVGVHSTNAPRSVYTATTHGCIRVHPDRIATLFQAVTVGTAGRVIYEPTLVAVVNDRVFVEVHPDIYAAAPPALQTIRAIAAAHGLESLVAWTEVEAAVKARDGVAVDVTAAPPPITR